MTFRIDMGPLWFRFYLFRSSQSTLMRNYIAFQFGFKTQFWTPLWLMRTYDGKFAYSVFNSGFVIMEKK